MHVQHVHVYANQSSSAGRRLVAVTRPARSVAVVAGAAVGWAWCGAALLQDLHDEGPGTGATLKPPANPLQQPGRKDYVATLHKQQRHHYHRHRHR
jgi:hypothetical protein